MSASSAFDPRGGLIVVPVRLFGPDGELIARMALDTGATHSLLNWPFAINLGYDPARANDLIEIITASGIEYAPRIILSRLQVLDLDKQNLAVACHTLPPSTNIDGVLGLDIFRGRKLTLDFRSGLITLE